MIDKFCKFCDLKHPLTKEFWVVDNQRKSGFGRCKKSKAAWREKHIKPLASFDLTKSDQLKKACHYKNLQPLWWQDNLRKGSKCQY